MFSSSAGPVTRLKMKGKMKILEKHPECKREDGGLSVIREWSGRDYCWESDVNRDGDGAASGNIVRDEHRVVAIGGGWRGWTYIQQVRSVAVNGRHYACGPWREEQLTWGDK
jgi:hypothetical protein